MTDRQLLEDAAKAAGVRIIGLLGGMIAQPDHRAGGFIIRNERGGDSVWNPLTDDGDALRLAVKSGLAVSVCTDYTAILGVYADGACVREDHKEDPCAATRRAITRAAAEIGRAIK